MDQRTDSTPGDGSATAMLTCSRCDGPVSADDLAEGIAVRIDGQPVCALCIESLPAHLKVQINRVRALKGLAVTTYRMRLAGMPKLFTFTNAGLLLMHQRALLSGTDFLTPDLPADRRVPLPGRPAPAKRSPLALVVGAAAAVLVVGGLVALIAVGSHRPAEPPRAAGTTPAAAPTAPTTPPEPAPASAATVEAVPAIAATEPHPDGDDAQPAPAARSWSQYLQTHPDPLAALAAAEADGADATTRERLTGEVVRQRTRTLEMAGQLVMRNDFTRAQQMLDALRPLPERAELADLQASELSLRHKLDYQRRQLRTAAGQPDPAPAPAPVAQAPAPVPPDAQPSTPTTGTADKPVPPEAVPADEPPKPAAPGRVGRQVVEWSEPFLTRDVVAGTPASESDIPAPWPTLGVGASEHFTRSAPLTNAQRKKIQQLVLGIPAGQVEGGGVGLLLHPNNRRRTIRISREDQPETVLQEVQLTPEEWQFVAVPLTAGGAGQVRLRLEDSEEIASQFWLGPVALVAGTAPTAEAVGLRDPALLNGNVKRDITSRRRLRDLLVAVAAKRDPRREWNDAKFMTFADAKLLVGGYTIANEKLRVQLANPLKQRWTHQAILTTHAIEPLVPDVARTFAECRLQPSKDQALTVFVPNGSEASLTPAEWLSFVSKASERALAGEKGRLATIPVWVIGTLDGKPLANPAQWERIRGEEKRWLVIDLTANPPVSVDDGARMVADALNTLAYQLRQAMRGSN